MAEQFYNYIIILTHILQIHYRYLKVKKVPMNLIEKDEKSS